MKLKRLKNLISYQENNIPLPPGPKRTAAYNYMSQSPLNLMTFLAYLGKTSINLYRRTQ